MSQISSEDVDFVNSKSLDEKVKFLQIADYLNIDSLMQLFSAAIAAYFRSNEFKDIKTEQKIDLEMTPDEEAQLLKEYPWIQKTEGGKYVEISEQLK